MTVITGAVMFCSSALAAMVSSVATTVRCLGCVPHWIAAAGISPGIPPSINASAMLARVFTPMYMTIVPPAFANADQFVWVPGLAGSSWPVTNVTDVARPR